MADDTPPKNAILITGATGKQGGATIDALIAADALKSHKILALTRDPQSVSAKKLESRGVRLVQGDLNDCTGVFSNAKRSLGEKDSKIWGVFSVQTSSSVVEETQGKALVDAAVANDTKFFVYTSVDRGGEALSPSNPTNVPHFISKHNIEKHLLASAAEYNKDKSAADQMKWVILRPVAFMENFNPGFTSKVMATSLRDVLGNKPIQLVSTRDVGWFAAQAFMRPHQFAGRSISLAGDELTYNQMNSVFRAQLGHDLPTTFSLTSRLVMGVVKDVGYMMRWFSTDGYGANISALRAENPGILTLKDWLARSEWSKNKDS